MKNILVLCAAAGLSLVATQQAQAQSESTALDIASQHEARGSARYQALGGAMGAIGTDFSSINQNPAGIAYFRSGSKVSLSLAHSTYGASSNWNGNNTDLTKKNVIHLDEISYMGNFLTGSGINVAYGIGIQNNGRIRNRTNAYSPYSGETTSLADFAKATANNVDPIVAPSITSPYNSGMPWISALGYEASWINYSSASNKYSSGYSSPLQDASLIIDQQGAVSNMDIAVAAEFSSVFSIGASLSLTSFDYDYASYYQEARTGKTSSGSHYGLSLDNKVSISGLGARLAAGFLVRPIESLRFGASVYIPTIYTNIRMDYFARATGISPQYASNGAIEGSTPSNGSTNFGMTLPWRYTLSAAYIFGRTAILSADYEYQDYSTARLKAAMEDDYDYYGYYEGSDNIYNEDNNAIKEDLGGQHTLRLGLELNLNRRLSARFGYRHSSAPKYTADLNLNQPEVGIMTPGTNVHYRLPGSVQTYSVGLGYKLSPKWTLDVAYSLREQNDKVGAFPYVRDVVDNIRYFPLDMIKDKQTQGNLTATISYRF